MRDEQLYGLNKSLDSGFVKSKNMFIIILYYKGIS